MVKIRCERFGDLEIPVGARTSISIGKLSLDQHPGCIIRSIRYDVFGGARKRMCKYSAHHGLREPPFPRFTNRGLIEARWAAASPIRLSSFRDLRIAASLKPQGLGWLWRFRAAFPRFTNRGLIEARIAVSGQNEIVRAFPRFTNRGLIEARRSRGIAHRATSFPRFTNRGLIEARSRIGERSNRPRSFPRFTNRGLIEATSRSNRTWRYSAPFRDLRIAASLKLKRPNVGPLLIMPFRDLRIAASLKLVKHHVRPEVPRSFPRFTNRGLIEASST